MHDRCLIVLVFALLWVPSVHAQNQGEAPADSVQNETADSVRTEIALSDTARADSLRADSLRRDSLRKTRAKTAAQEAAERWLALVDANEFAESWDAADSTFQAQISREDWLAKGEQFRGQLKDMRARQLVQVQYRDSAQHAPPSGPVVTLQYRTDFVDDATQELLVTTEADTTWRVVGYRVVPVWGFGEAGSPVTMDSSDAEKPNDKGRQRSQREQSSEP